MTTTRYYALRRGFTLVEAVIVMAVTAIVATMLVVFIRVPVIAYADSSGRAAASDEADTAMRRLARDLRLALPNSVRVTVTPAGHTYLEYLETTAGLRYQAEDDIDTTLDPATYLNWNDSSKLVVGVVGGVPGGRHAPKVNDYLVVYNLGEGQAPANAYDCSTVCNRAQIASMTGTTLTMVANPFAAQTVAGPAMTSPGKRMHVVTGPVTYHCDPVSGTLRRHWNYPITAVQSQSPGGSSALLASNVTGCAFTYDSQLNRRSGLVGVRLTLRIPAVSTGVVTLVHQIHVNNTP